MKKISFHSWLLASSMFLLLSLGGCDTSSTQVASQTVDGIAWLPDGSGIIAYLDQTTESTLDGSTSEGANLYHVGLDGSIGNAINSSSISVDLGYLPSTPQVFVSSDGQTAITQFGTDIFTVGINNGNITDIIQNTGLLGVSPDFKYVLTTSSSASFGAAFIKFWSVSNNVPTLIGETKTIVKMGGNRALWLSNDDFALTINDSTASNRTHVTVYDFSGDSLTSIPDADVSISAAAFSPGSNDLFVRNHLEGIDRIHFNSPATYVRTSIISNDSVDSMDASSDGSLLVYTSASSALTYGTLFAVNVADTNKVTVTTGVAQPVLSPKADKVAYSNSNSGIQVVSVQTPP
ncbi:MAG TPA: hypothetical protein VGM92_00025 [Candidatus Kapabacteria bacterium]